MEKSLLQDLEKVIQYLWVDEQKNWEELDMPASHIFNSVNRLNTYLSKQKNNCEFSFCGGKAVGIVQTEKMTYFACQPHMKEHSKK